MRVYRMSVRVAEIFYKVCKDLNLKTEKERVTVLHELVENGMINSVSSTDRTKEQIIEDYSKHFRTLQIGDVHGSVGGDDGTDNEDVSGV